MSAPIMIWVVAPIVGFAVGYGAGVPFEASKTTAAVGTVVAWAGYFIWWQVRGKQAAG
jgi:hypothetical protein